MSVMERVSLEEKINNKVWNKHCIYKSLYFVYQAKQKSSEDMSLLMTKLQSLQKSLISEQSRVKLLLTNKDNIIR